MLTLSEVWPLFELSVSSPRLELRIVRDDDLPGIIDAVLAGIHDPAVMPFSVPWTDAPREELIRETARHQWRTRISVRPDHWVLNFVVLFDDVPVGIQDVVGANFPLRRTVSTGSWLTRAHQGKGLGREMRAAVLLFAFDHLGAEVAESNAAHWNAASLGVSHSLGYRDGGVKREVTRPGTVDLVQDVRLEAAGFIRPGWDIQVRGLDAARRELALS